MQDSPAVIARVKVDSQGRVVLDAQARRMAEVSPGDELEERFFAGPDGSFIFVIVRPRT